MLLSATWLVRALLPCAWVLKPAGALTVTVLKDPIQLDAEFEATISAYWTNLNHARRVNFACTPSGKTCYLAYLEHGIDKVHVLTLDGKTFKSTAKPVVIDGHEAGGLVAHEDGFALLTNQNVAGSNAPKYPITIATRYTGGKESWKIPLNGPGVHPDFGLTSTPDINGDLVYSEKARLYCAYFVVTAYTGAATGHFGDSIMCFDQNGKRDTGPYNSPWGCSHNTGIGFEAADEPPFASVCAEDQGAIWLNTETRGMGSGGVKIANENAVQGSSGEPMYGMSGSYSNLARFQNSTRYIFGWESRGALHLKKSTFMKDEPKATTCQPRWNNHNVAIAIMKDKKTLLGKEAISTVNAEVGDENVNFITRSNSMHHQNVHVATFDSNTALVSWDNIKSTICEPLPETCKGKYGGTSYLLVDSEGKMQGEEVNEQTGVTGDMVTMTDGRICWPTTPTDWSYEEAKIPGANVVNVLRIACAVSGKMHPTNGTRPPK